MKHFILFCIAALTLCFTGCKKEHTNPTTNNGLNVSWYKNTSGNPNADALQYQVIDPSRHFTLLAYGTFASDSTPNQINTLTFQKDGNDTIVYYLLNPQNQRVQSSYISVQGVKQPWVCRFDYATNNDSSAIFSLYSYDWASNTGTLKLQCSVTTSQGNSLWTPTYYAFKNNASGSPLARLSNVLGALALTDIIIVGAGGTTTALLSVGTAAAAAAFLGPVLAGVATVAILAYALNPSSASAASILPTNSSIPVNNPTSGGNNPTPNLPAPVNPLPITITAHSNVAGAIYIDATSGGTPPYTYAVDNITFQTQPVFTNQYTNGFHYIYVKDSNGMIGTTTVSVLVNKCQGGLCIGQSYQGGVIAYFYQPGDQGYVAGQTHGIIVDSSDLGVPLGAGASWGCPGTITGAQASGVGYGLTNTNTILVNCSTSGIAAQLCSSLTRGGYSDWYLPSIDELEKLYEFRLMQSWPSVNYVLFPGNYYWSSTEVYSNNANGAYYYDFFDGTGIKIETNKQYYNSVRAIRSF
jgi:Protein of unknown function (DUF1566)